MLVLKYSIICMVYFVKINMTLKISFLPCIILNIFLGELKNRDVAIVTASLLLLFPSGNFNVGPIIFNFWRDCHQIWTQESFGYDLQEDKSKLEIVS